MLATKNLASGMMRLASARSSPLATQSRFMNTAAAAAPKEITVNLLTPWKTHRCDPPPSQAVTTRDELLDFYYQMSLMRRVEIASDQLYKEQKIRGFLHLYTGQEAVCVGMEAVLTKKDHVITAYRDHAIFMGRGGSMVEVIAELLGRSAGCAKGKGGSMHFYKTDTNFYGGNGIVGAQVPVGTGIAFAQKYLGNDQICVTMYGDGAANQGKVFEAFNLAALWKLPVVYIVENNQYAMGTSTQRSFSGTEYYTRGDYVPGLKVDGMDVLAVKTAMTYAKNFALTQRPILLEVNTYRYAGHSMSDPGVTYRTHDEVEKVRETRDAITKTKQLLLTNNLATEKELTAIDKKVKEEVVKAVEAAKKSPEPELRETFTQILIEPTFVRGVELCNSFSP